MRDEVDDLAEAWARERPDLDLTPVAVFSRISRLSRRVDLARRDAFAPYGIELWEFDVLATLRRAGAPYELQLKGKQHLLRCYRLSVVPTPSTD